MMVMAAGCSSMRLPSTLRTAPPAPTSRTRRCLISTPLPARSRTSPGPSVESPWTRPEPSNRIVLTARTRSARALLSSTYSQACSLNGRVTFSPASACLPERLDAGAEFVERGEQRPVVYRLPCLCGEQAMDPGRQAVRYRVADDGVVIHLIIVQQLLDYRVYSTVISQICYWVRPAVILALNSGHPLI